MRKNRNYMKYFIDTEFIEGFHKPLFGKKRHFIDLISIGIYCEDGRQLHLLSNEYNYNDASDWLKQNVLTPLYTQLVHGDQRNQMGVSNFHKHKGVSNTAILTSLFDFFYCWRDQHFWRVNDSAKPEIYGYYSDYDWVLFCSLFGQMIDLPKGFPMYCIDLKQKLDEFTMRGDLFDAESENLPFGEKLKLVKAWDGYPKQENEHNAIADAKWNYELYNFLNTHP